MKVENQVMPSPQRAMEFFGGPEDGPFVMVNLLIDLSYAWFDPRIRYS